VAAKVQKAVMFADLARQAGLKPKTAGRYLKAGKLGRLPISASASGRVVLPENLATVKAALKRAAKTAQDAARVHARRRPKACSD